MARHRVGREPRPSLPRQKAPAGARRRFRIYYEEVTPVWVEVVATSKRAAREVATVQRPGERAMPRRGRMRRKTIVILREEEL